MTGFATSLIERTIKIINDPEFLNVSKTKAEYFTRKRKLCFHDVMALCLNILAKSVQIEISDFIKKHMPSLEVVFIGDKAL